MATGPKSKSILGTVYKNSEIPEDLLVVATDGKKLFKLAAESILRIKEAALRDGFTFQITSGFREGGQKGDGLRYLRGEVEFTQWAAWELYNNDKAGILIDPQTQKEYKIGPASKDPKFSRPGIIDIKDGKGFNLASDPTNGFSSNHGFGLAVDIYGKDRLSSIPVATWVKDNPTGLGVREKVISFEGLKITREKQDAFQEWFVKNGPYYGWTWTGRTYKSIEPWHFDYEPLNDKSRTISNFLAKRTPQQINQATKIQQASTFNSKLKTNLIKSCFRNPFE